MNLNFSEVGKELKMTPQGARKRILKYQHEDKLKPYLIFEKDQLVGLEQDGIEILRQLGAHRRSFTKDRELNELKHKIELIEQENRFLKEGYEREKAYSEDYKQENQKLKAELNEINNMSFFKRLTYKPKV